MNREIFLTRTCNLGFETVANQLETDPSAVLGPATGAAATAANDIVLNLDTSWAWFDIHEQVQAHIGELSRAVTRATLPLSWEANRHKRLLPAVTGHLRVDAMSSIHAEISYIGEYTPPTGIFTTVGDLLLGQRVAQAAIGHLLDQIVAHLEQQQPRPALVS